MTLVPAPYRRRSELVTAIQFDPAVTPWPQGVDWRRFDGSEYGWWHNKDGHLLRPGYWIVTMPRGTEIVYTEDEWESMGYGPVERVAPPQPSEEAIRAVLDSFAAKRVGLFADDVRDALKAAFRAQFGGEKP